MMIEKILNFIIPTCCFYLMILNTLVAQSPKLTVGEYLWSDKDSFSFGKINIDQTGELEFLLYNVHDCTNSQSIYGKGKYRTLNDSIIIDFDTIPQKKSEHSMISIINKDEYLNIKIQVVDQNKKPISNLKLHWRIARNKNKRKAFDFFEKEFNDSTVLNLSVKEKLEFIQIKKDGYFSSNIIMPKNISDDFDFFITLRPKPRILAGNYISGKTLKFSLISDCVIKLSDKMELKNESCH